MLPLITRCAQTLKVKVCIMFLKLALMNVFSCCNFKMVFIFLTLFLYWLSVRLILLNECIYFSLGKPLLYVNFFPQGLTAMGMSCVLWLYEEQFSTLTYLIGKISIPCGSIVTFTIGEKQKVLFDLFPNTLSVLLVQLCKVFELFAKTEDSAWNSI